MMVRGEFQERSNHWVVGAEGREALARRDRPQPAKQRSADDSNGFVQVRVRVPAIDVPFAPGSRVELAALQRLPLEIDGRLELQSARTRYQENVGLREVAFGEIAAMDSGSRVGQLPDSVQSQHDVVGLFRHVVSLGVQGRGGTNQKQQHEGCFHRPGLYTGCGPSFAKPNAFDSPIHPCALRINTRKKKKLNTTAQMV